MTGPPSFDYTFETTADGAGRRRRSLKEMPSFREQVHTKDYSAHHQRAVLLIWQASQALSRRDDLQRIKQRLSMNREILHEDPSTKPWLRKLSSVDQHVEPPRRVSFDRNHHSGGLYEASPARIVSEEHHAKSESSSERDSAIMESSFEY